MGLGIKTFLQRAAWKLLGNARPASGQVTNELPPVDTIAPRKAMVDNAVVIVAHNTREEAKTGTAGNSGSLLGDYLEFGVFRGDTFIHAYRRANAVMPFMRFWAFDSFAGLPDLVGIDRGGEFQPGQFACDQETFTSNLRAAGVDLGRVQIVPGWFNESLTPDLKRERKLTVASIAYIDADLYHSTVPVLDFLTDVLATGSVVMFDDWFCFRGDPNRGVQRAWNEWLAKNPQYTATDYHLFGPYGKSFIMVRNGVRCNI